MDAWRKTRANTGTHRRRLKLPDRSYVARAGVLVVVYFITAKLGLLMDAVDGLATTVWPPTGVSLVALSLFGYRLWPGIAAGAFLVNYTAGAPFLAACGMSAGNTLEALVGTYLLRRFAGFRGSLDRIQAVVGLVVLAAGVSTMMSATIGVTSAWLGGVIPSASFGKAWSTWWLGDAMGDLILAPLLFAWAEPLRNRLPPARVAEAGALMVSLVMVCMLAFHTAPVLSGAVLLQPYLVFPLLIWAALRFWQRGTMTATFLVTGLAIWRTAQGFGPFARGTVNDSLLSLQAFMGVVAVTMLIMAAGVAERRRVEQRVKANYAATRVLAVAPSLEEGLPGILRAICESLDWDCGNVWSVDVATNTLVHHAEWHRLGDRLGEFAETASRVTFGPGVGLAGRVWSESRPLWIPNLAEEANFVRAGPARELGLRSAMGFPIFLDRDVHGVMTFLSRKALEPDEPLLQMMTTLGSQIGQFIERRKAECDLRRAHAELEDRITLRTEQISRMNQSLQEEISERAQAEDSLRQLSTRLLRIQDEERRRLARELHDSTAQSLAALSMNLAVARGNNGALGGRARIALDESERLAERCAREIRSMSYLLHPPLLEEVGLPAALRWCAEGFSRHSGIEVDLDLPSDFGRLPVDVETALFRIVQECLTNVQRHSGSPTTRIRLVRNPRRVAMEIQDQGRGMPAGVLSRREGVESLGVGLLGMRERVRQLGGQLSIDSSRKGTTVQVEIALPMERV
jgi:signal transduction histidine kinase